MSKNNQKENHALMHFLYHKIKFKVNHKLVTLKKVFIRKVSINDGSAAVCSRIVDEEGNSNVVDVDLNVGVYICDSNKQRKML